MLEFFSGSGVMSKSFKKDGWDTVTIDINPDFNPDIADDVYNYLSVDVLKDKIGAIPDVIWASPDCTTYSVASISYHRKKAWNNELMPITDYARYCDEHNRELIRFLKSFNGLYFIENPIGAMRKMTFMHGIPRYSVTFCQYGDFRQKPTDIWTNHPNPQFKPCCKRGDPCHETAKRGTKCGSQRLKNAYERAIIPTALCEHIVKICNEYYNKG